MQPRRDEFLRQELPQHLAAVFLSSLSTFAGHLGSPPQLLSSTAPTPSERGGCSAACVPCVASPAARWRTSGGRLTAGSPAVPCDQLCVSAATVAGQRALRQAILDRNSSIPPSKQTSATLKVNRNLDRDADNSGGSWPPACLSTLLVQPLLLLYVHLLCVKHSQV